MNADEPRPRRRFRNIAQLVLLCLFTGFGLFITVVVAIDWLQAVDTFFWQQTTCTIDSSQTIERPEYGDFALEVSYHYQHGGQQFVADRYRHGGNGFDAIADAQRQAARYEAGTTTPCWVDPDDPEDAYLLRANLWRGLWIFLPLIFVAIGGGMLWFLYGPPPPAPSAADANALPVAEKVKPWKAGALMIGFFGIFFLFGVGFLIPVFIWPTLEVVEARAWQPVACEILSSEVESHTGDDSVTYSIETLYRYEIDGREHLSSRYQFMGGSSSGYEAKAAAVAEIPAGARLTCYVNPEDPFDAVIERGFTGDYLFGLIPLLFALVGLGGMIFAVAAMRSMKKDAAKPSWPEKSYVRLSDSASTPPPGPIKLEPRMGPFGKLGCAASLALFWNGIVSVFVWVLISEWRTGARDWFLVLFLIPFVLIGLLLLAGIPYGLLALVNPRPRLRLSPGIVRAGQPFEIDWSFRGAASRITGLKLWLESSKTTTETEIHDSGGSIRTNTDVMDTIEILEHGPEASLEFGSVSFTIPEDALPTSEGDEAISWKVKLQGVINYWPDVNEEYEIQVLPFVAEDS